MGADSCLVCANNVTSAFSFSHKAKAVNEDRRLFLEFLWRGGLGVLMTVKSDTSIRGS